MSLVDDDRVVPQQVPVVVDLGEQDAVGHQLHQRVRAGVVTEPDRVAHCPADRRTGLLGNALRQGARRDPTRLGVTDHAADPAAELQAQLGQLGGLPRTRLAGNDHHLIALDRRAQVGDPIGDRELGRDLNGRDDAASRREPLPGAPQLCLELGHRTRPPPGIPELPDPIAAPAESIGVDDPHLIQGDRRWWRTGGARPCAGLAASAGSGRAGGGRGRASCGRCGFGQRGFGRCGFGRRGFGHDPARIGAGRPAVSRNSDRPDQR